MKNIMIMFMMSLFLFFVGCGSEGNSFSAEAETEDINTVSEKDSVVAFLNSVSEDKKDTIDADTLFGEDFTVVMNMIAVESSKKRAPEGIRVSTDTVFVIDTVIVYDTIYVDKARNTDTKAMPETKESPSKKIDIEEIDEDKDDSGVEKVTTVELEIGECVETEFGAACADPEVEGGR